MGRSRPAYSAHHVNVMAAMIDRWHKGPFEIVCITDDPEGIDGSIRIVPLWDDLKNNGRCFVRLKAFAKGMDEILGPKFASLDLDTVICGPIDETFAPDVDFMIWSDPSRITPYCGSQWMVKPGSHPEVFDKFDPVRAASLKAEFGYFGSDQAWLSYMLPNAPVWTKAHGIYSFRMHLMRNYGGDPVGVRFRKRLRARGTPKLPHNARIVHFHGAYDPSQKMIQDLIPWVKEHWRLANEAEAQSLGPCDLPVSGEDGEDRPGSLGEGNPKPRPRFRHPSRRHGL
jgi:hypothetical protein